MKNEILFQSISTGSTESYLVSKHVNGTDFTHESHMQVVHDMFTPRLNSHHHREMPKTWKRAAALVPRYRARVETSTLTWHNRENTFPIDRSQSKMSSNAVTPSREQLTRQTGRLIEELESTWDHDVEFSSPSSMQLRSPRFNGKTSTRGVKFDLGPSSNLSGVIAEGGGETKNNSDTSTTNSLLKNRRPTPYKPVVDARLALSPPPASTFRKAKTVTHREALTDSATSVTPRSPNASDANSLNSLAASEYSTPSKGEPLNNKVRRPSTRHVSFSSDVNFTSSRSPTKMRRCTPHKQINPRDRVAAVSPARPISARKTSSLLQTGAVRMNVVYYTNPRRMEKPGSNRLIDSGAVRKVVSRHTTPRKLIGNRNMWSPPPSTGRLKLRDLNVNTPPKNEIKTPSKNELSISKRSNASTGGHKFRALLTSQHKSPTVDRDVSRTLFH